MIVDIVVKNYTINANGIIEDNNNGTKNLKKWFVNKVTTCKLFKKYLVISHLLFIKQLVTSFI